MFAQRQRHEALRGGIGHPLADRLRDRRIERAIGKSGQFAHHAVQRKDPGQIANRQRRRQRQPFAAQRHARFFRAGTGAARPGQRILAAALAQQRRQLALTLQRLGQEGRMGARPLDRFVPIAAHIARLPHCVRESKRFGLPEGAGSANFAP